MDLLSAARAEAATVPVELHEPATWTPAGGAARAVEGIYRQVSEITDIGGLLAADGVTARFDAASAALEGVKMHDTVTVRSRDLRVVGIEPNGRGRTILALGI